VIKLDFLNRDFKKIFSKKSFLKGKRKQLENIYQFFQVVEESEIEEKDRVARSWYIKKAKFGYKQFQKRAYS
jgi:hypothetical protein